MHLITQRARRIHDDGGFTLVELIVTVAIFAIIALPLAASFSSYFKNSNSTSARIAESSDAQFAATYFAQDVASTGHRGGTWPFPLVQSVWITQTGVSCGTGVGNAVLILAGDNFPGSADTPSTVYVAYELNGTSLHRVRCSSTGTTDLVLARNVISATPTCAPTSCGTPSSVPATIQLVLQFKASGDTGVGYSVTLTGDRRQT
jgi:prepilin-type N-terminal cleavage/methylation domain-containing protein